ncbi:hypothetical protein EBB07_08780 [Paenibacillaceae bacterium]|nr:hypothetical protein EBB07_08780 [Paenibacillaceae bacterium]
MTEQSSSLFPAAFQPLPLGSIRPAGWLLDQLRIQADGLTGHLEEHWADVGPDNGWIGGQGESWERGPYYIDGLVPLAYLLQDDRLIAKASRWVEWSLNSQRADGDFGPERIETVNHDVDKKQDWWHYMIMLKVLTQYAEATGDERIVPFLENYFRFVRSRIEDWPLQGWAKARGAELMLSILWLHERNGDERLIELARIVASQTLNWTDIFHDFPYWRKVKDFDWSTHVVNVAMGLKTPALRHSLFGGDREHAAVHRGIDSLMTYHGQAHGMFSGDEFLSGTHPSQGVELCAVVEYMFTMEQLIRVFGEGRFGDILEKVAFNALPATISPDWGAHQYDQQVNQIVCNIAPRPWVNGSDANLFGLEPNFGCCTANMHQGWPKLVSHLWMSDRRGGLAAISYAPCTVNTKVGTGAQLTLEVEGQYPFRELITMSIALDRPETFALRLRIPQWCDAPYVEINGTATPLDPASQGYCAIEREWRDGDVVQLKLPMEVRLHSRHLYAASVERGPLVYVMPIVENWQLLRKREKFHDWELYPGSPWKYGLLAETSFHVTTSEAIPKQPFEASGAPVTVTAKGCLVRNWHMEKNNAGTPPHNPDVAGQDVVDIALIPYGSARLRIGEFPLIRNNL